MPAPRVTSNSPWHIVLVLDDSGSMADSGKATMLNEALDAMIEEMRLQTQGMKAYFRMSVIAFGSHALILSEASDEKTVDKGRITSFAGNSGGTDIAAALNEATNVLKRNPGKPTDFDPYVFLLTDGKADNEDEALRAVASLKELTIAAGKPRVIAIGLGVERDVNMPFLRNVATNPELAKHLKNASDLVRFFPQIGTIVSSMSGTAAIDAAIIDI